MSARPTSTVSTELELYLMVPGGSSLSVAADVRYDSADPYAVRVAFYTGPESTQTGEVVEWTFARELLTDGVTRRVGEGDVQVWPAHGAQAQVVCLSLSSPSGTALFEVPLAQLVEFLSRTYQAVPTGHESRFVDLDAELALLLWTGAAE
ncbi:MAG TPA: SsgA family sporulation/cell division regulator [Mycobacteriales bacterium]|jgi:hypothetical protein|nr:SsgA family sporulation/cell division regulator [Mycobacteriales bacterium]